MNAHGIVRFKFNQPAVDIRSSSRPVGEIFDLVNLRDLFNPFAHFIEVPDRCALENLYNLAQVIFLDPTLGEVLAVDKFWRDTSILQENTEQFIFRNPLTWLWSGGVGVVVLDWTWARDLLLGFDVIAEDVELGNRLDAALKPEIWVMETAA